MTQCGRVDLTDSWRRWAPPGTEVQDPVCGVVGCTAEAWAWVVVVVDRAVRRNKVILQQGELNLCERHARGGIADDVG